MVKLRLLEAEGTPEEIRKISELFGSNADQVGKQIGAPDSSNAPPDGVSADEAVSPELVRQVLTRRELSSDIKKDLQALKKAGSKGMTSQELAKAIGIDRGQLAGVHGAFGRRIANTKGWPTGAEIIEKYRDENGHRRHRLSAVARTALEKLEL